MPTPDEKPRTFSMAKPEEWPDSGLVDAFLAARDQLARLNAEAKARRSWVEELAGHLYERAAGKAFYRDGLAIVLIEGSRLPRVVECLNLDERDAEIAYDGALARALELARTGHVDGLPRLAGMVSVAVGGAIPEDEAFRIAMEVDRLGFDGPLSELVELVQTLRMRESGTIEFRTDPRD